MKTKKKVVIGIGLVTAVGLIICLVHRHKTNRMQEKVAEHGYETAYDILFPGKKEGGRKNKYGPVIPS